MSESGGEVWSLDFVSISNGGGDKGTFARLDLLTQ
jgi:hypothetical protein